MFCHFRRLMQRGVTSSRAARFWLSDLHENQRSCARLAFYGAAHPAVFDVPLAVDLDNNARTSEM